MRETYIEIYRFIIIMLRLTPCRLKKTFKAPFTKKWNNSLSYDCCEIQKIHSFLFLSYWPREWNALYRTLLIIKSWISRAGAKQISTFTLARLVRINTVRPHFPWSIHAVFNNFCCISLGSYGLVIIASLNISTFFTEYWSHEENGQ